MFKVFISSLNLINHSKPKTEVKTTSEWSTSCVTVLTTQPVHLHISQPIIHLKQTINITCSLIKSLILEHLITDSHVTSWQWLDRRFLVEIKLFIYSKCILIIRWIRSSHDTFLLTTLYELHHMTHMIWPEIWSRCSTDLFTSKLVNF